MGIAKNHSRKEHSFVAGIVREYRYTFHGILIKNFPLLLA